MGDVVHLPGAEDATADAYERWVETGEMPTFGPVLVKVLTMARAEILAARSDIAPNES
ncbi:hypothetical protein J2S40_001155 [Nocardioides luteus]|uniref:Uncharacterized protein n=1 Tax=Nocardioides luteus TaxID=1844 RepID=A0ABQ5SSM0_9ACTN|nr:hypothetical protein [Nocardioides luteus]MDR7310097.1 hypothetical protein [Nocardioides luteus]GGR64804.1 hypothetical protein GCM10010197_35340 [Nocardioides luteus]GLJ66995.1 hypothetical protein GCM10017579_10310 [Nocardioides luteus]